MNKWYEVKVKYIKELPDGSLKKVSELYVLDGVSVTDSEARIIEEVGSFVRGEFVVESSKEMKLDEVVGNDEADGWFIAKIACVIVNGDTGKEKDEVISKLFQSDTIEDALAMAEESMKGVMMKSRVEELKRTKIIDVFPFKEDK